MKDLLIIMAVVLLVASCNKGAKTDISDAKKHHDYVDLGLSVYWSTTNIGADKETDYGDFFAWGENKVKDYYDDCTYKYRIEDVEMFGHQFYRYTKYVTNENSRDDLYDNKLELDDEDDAAIVLWKEKWRMPTEKEFKELLDKRNCFWEWYPVGNSKFDGVAGFKVTSRIEGYKGRDIFLPAAGFIICDEHYHKEEYVCYWSKSLNSFDDIYDEPYALCFGKDLAVDIADKYYRFKGFTIRPVIPKSTKPALGDM